MFIEVKDTSNDGKGIDFRYTHLLEHTSVSVHIAVWKKKRKKTRKSGLYQCVFLQLCKLQALDKSVLTHRKSNILQIKLIGRQFV